MKRDTSRFYNYPPLLPHTDPSRMMKEIALYIHIPFCRSLCHYCPFNKTLISDELVKRYIVALKKEMKLSTKPGIVKAIYIGGGTPTSLKTEQLIEIFRMINDHFTTDRDAQITVESNPSTIDLLKLKALKKAGANRISFGIQSFNDETLRALGCAHNQSEAIESIKIARKAGFDEINIDLMYRLPGQTLAKWQSEVKTFITTGADHLSTYALDITPGTMLHKRRELLLPKPSLKEEEKILDITDDMLRKEGFERYNIEQFCKDGKKNYYGIFVAQGEVLGLGAGAFSHINGFEYRNLNKTEEYISCLEREKLPICLGKKLSGKEQMERFIIKSVLFLRINKKEFRDRFGIEISRMFRRKVKKLQDDGLIEENDVELRVTRKGMLYIYNICKEFYSKEYLQLIKSMEECRSGKSS